MTNHKEFEWKEIPGPSETPVEYVLRSGNPGHVHEYGHIKSVPNYQGQCRVCECGRIETSPAPGELAYFRNMAGEYVVEENGRPGMRSDL
ncbi:MAG: hypothetical protein AAB529_02980 [Patescibacteria group bacterium]